MNRIVVIAVLILGIILVSSSIYFDKKTVSQLSIDNFEECAAAGYPIMESYPARCRTPDGKVFVQYLEPGSYRNISFSSIDQGTALNTTRGYNVFNDYDKLIQFIGNVSFYSPSTDFFVDRSLIGVFNGEVNAKVYLDVFEIREYGSEYVIYVNEVHCTGPYCGTNFTRYPYNFVSVPKLGDKSVRIEWYKKEEYFPDVR